MRKVLRPLCVLLFLGVGVLSLFAETEEKKSPPVIPEGRVNAGKTLFVEKGCFQCHTAGDIKLPGSELDDTLLIGLGGSKDRKWTRDDFARAILNPAHTVSPEYEKAMIILGDHFKAVNSPMPGFNDILTASDLIHLTTFLTSLTE